MTRARRYKNVTLVVLIALFAACTAATPTPAPTPSPTRTRTPYPTYTPYPTLTPYPTYTPLPPTPTLTPLPTLGIGDAVRAPRWSVRVVKAEPTLEFETYYLKEDARTRMVVVTIEYTYLGGRETIFSPESVLLVYTGSEGLTGWARTPVLYRGEVNTDLVSFKESTIAVHIAPGTTRVERFIYEFPKEYTSFRLYFPETESVAVTLE